jgi:hypothetical protein
MKRKIILALVLAVVLSGCATKRQVWTKPDLDQLTFERDRSQCEYEAMIYTPPSNAGGYYRSAGSAFAAGLAAGISDAIRRAELAQQCMRAKGYYLVTMPTKSSPAPPIVREER